VFASRARRIGVAVGLAVVAGAVVIFAAGSGDSDSLPDRSVIAANRLCHTARQEIGQAMQQRRRAFDSGDPSPLARSMFDAVGKLQLKLGNLDVADDMLEQAVELKQTVFEAEQPIIDLIRIAVPEPKRILVDAKELESIEIQVHDLASSLGYDECARLRLRLPPVPR
jgi:hypothetical protein